MKLLRVCLTGAALISFAVGASAVDQKTQDLYKTKCQGCHRADGKASALGKKLGAKDFQDPDVVKMSETELITITTSGKNKMPAYKGKLTDDQIKDFVKYIKEMK